LASFLKNVASRGRQVRYLLRRFDLHPMQQEYKAGKGSEGKNTILKFQPVLD
jgi:hypothetical protein